MSDYNKMPQNAVEIPQEKVYEELQDFFIYHKAEERRSVFYENENIYSGLADVYIWWIKKEVGIGFALKRDWKEEKMRWYKLGIEEEWEKFRRGFAANFHGDIS